ncbi:Fic family protein [Pasteurella testudinis DSM 23072]|uniref:Fic family protein n=1 Tax=Pasteurella testudinis DSM 23072 TaxID=1122938 RepID=A0A1W1V2I0_9PAST|nr:Fic family protein [Pasteurella testudinis]SMB87535.1 Fic family protein [Pasteurella testudinis DSM 23072]SUB50520.1 Fic/DOC family [Pasteurella testudinis]
MKITKPKPLHELTELLKSTDIEDLIAFSNFNATDEKGRYLHWDKFRRIYTKNTELSWLATKMSRSSLMSRISIGNTKFSFCVPSSLQSLLHYIDKNSGGSVGASNLTGLSKPEQNHFLLKSLIMEEAITSAQLEGAVTIRKAAKEMLETERAPKTKDEMMILNNYRLMQKAIMLKNEPLSIETILSLHRTATHNAIENNAVSGEFRADDEIYIADYDGNNIYQPPAHNEIAALMNDFCHFANSDHSGEESLFIHPVIKAIILHFLIGYIHPFGDGNGRTARALFYWFMLKNGYWLFEYISISRLLKNAARAYAKAYIYIETDDLDMTYFLYYQAETIKRAIVDLEKYINDKQSRFKEFIAVISRYTDKATLNHRQIQILQKAVKETGHIFTAKEISNEYGISENTARKDLNALLNLKLFGSLKAGQTIGYISPNDLIERLKN